MKIIGLVTFFAIAFSASSHADQPATHGMLLFGNNATYASHLPMFHSPHDYQLLLKLSLRDNPTTIAKYNDARASFPGIFTLVPERMDLSMVAKGIRSSFRAEIYQGHFERDGKSLGQITVAVEKVIYAMKLHDGPPPDDNQYLIFGAYGEYFGIHLVEGRPNFDAVVSVIRPYHMVEQPCRARVCGMVKRQVPDNELPLTLAATTLAEPQPNDQLGILDQARTEIQTVIYDEKGDLDGHQ